MKPILRLPDGTAKRDAEGLAENACDSSCCSQCCGADCVLATFTNWPAYRFGSLPTVIDPLAFLDNGGDPWKLQRIGACHFVYDCAVSITIGGVNYIEFVLDAFVSRDNTGTMYIQSLVGYLVPDTGDIADVIYIIPPDAYSAADAPGCDQTITTGLEDFPDAELTVSFASGNDCTDEDCEAPDSCTLCCPDVTCARCIVHITVEYTPFAGGTTIGYEYDFPLVRGTPTNCWYAGLCINPATGAATIQGVAHIICDADGNPKLLHLGFTDYTTGVALLVNTPVGISCSGTTTPTIDHTFFNPINIVSVSATISIELKDECDDVENCTQPTHPGACPEACFECADPACGPICLFGSVLTIGYTINTGECGDCTCANSIDCCGQCCDDPPVPGGGPVPACASHIVADQADCEGHGWFWSCLDDCFEEGGGTTSPCSFTNITGTLAMDWVGITGAGDEANWSASVDFGGTVGVVNFALQFKCSTGRWYFSATWLSGRCVAEGNINGNCDSFTSITLNMRDTVNGHTCAGGTVGTITFTSLDLVDYTCP